MNNAIKMLLSNERHALKSLNEVFHIDFEKPYEAVLIEGKTTIKQILKSLNSPDDSLILVLNHTTDKYIFGNRYIVGVIDTDESLEIEFRPHYFHAEKLDTYNIKADFRDHLKRTDLSDYHIVISQKKDFIKATKEPYVDYAGRFKVPPMKCYSYVKGSKWELDKSGYAVEYYRNDLQRRAKALKADRAKAAYLATDNTKKLNELRTRIEARKLELVEYVKAADNANAFKVISKATNFYSNGFADIMDSFERMEKRVNEKSYKSIEDFERSYKAISDMLIENNKILAELIEIQNLTKG